MSVSTLSLATAIWQSPEHRADEVAALYRQLLHRPADAQALAYWGGQLLGGQSEEQVAARILASPEYTAAHPDAASFAGGLYADVLGRALDRAGAAYWEGLLQGGASPSFSLPFPFRPGRCQLETSLV